VAVLPIGYADGVPRRLFAVGGEVLIGDDRLDPGILADLAASFDLVPTALQTLPMKFACPSAVLRDGSTNQGATETFQPWADAVAAG
jgi:gamma-glutamyltranspeptidase/glutathione hydrolase